MSTRIKAVQGNLPIVLVAAHGGSQKPEKIPDRRHLMTASEPQVPDLFTDTLVDEIIANMSPANGLPYAIVADIARTKVDLNAPPDRAYVGNGRDIFDHFHDQIDQFCDEEAGRRGWVLLVDLHGFVFRDSPVELTNDIVLGTQNGRTLPVDGPGMLTRASFMQFLSSAGWQVCPNNVETETVFPGGYIVRCHSQLSTRRYAIQVEIASTIRKAKAKRLRLAGDLATWLQRVAVKG